MARVVFLFFVFTFILAGLVHGRPKKTGTISNGESSNQGFDALKTQLQNALNENSAPAILSALSLPTLKICSTASPLSATPTTQAANTNEQDFGWLFDLVSTALSQPTIQKMKIVLKSNLKLRRKLCGGSTRPSTRPISSSTPTTLGPVTTQPAPPPVVATSAEVKTETVGVSSFVDVALKDEGKSRNTAMPTGPTAPTRPAAVSGQPATPTHPRATEQAPADALADNYYRDEFLSIPAMRKRRSLASDDVQEAMKTGPPKEDAPPDAREIIPASNDGVGEGGETGSLEHREAIGDDDEEQEFHVAAVIPATVFPAEDEQAAIPRVKITASNLLEDGQFDETITIYPEYHDQDAATNQKEQKQKKEETLQDQKTPSSNAETSSEQIETAPKLRDETKLEVTRNKNEMKPEDPLDENLRADDVMVTKKEMFSADEMPEQLPSPEENHGRSNDDQLNSTEDKRNLDLLPVEPSQMMRNELDELKREDWQVKKAPKGEEIKYEVDDEPAERITKRKAKNRLKTKLGKLRKKNTIA